MGFECQTYLKWRYLLKVTSLEPSGFCFNRCMYILNGCFWFWRSNTTLKQNMRNKINVKNNLQVTTMFLTKFRVDWFFFSRRQSVKKNRFLGWPSWRPYWISDRNDFSYFWSKSHPDASYHVSSPLIFRFRKGSEKLDFQDGRHSGHLRFLIETILATFALQVIPMLLSKFWVKWPLGSGEEAKNKFSRWWPWRPSWIFDQNDFRYFCSTSHPDASY